MTEKQLIEKIKTLKQAKPSSEWLALTRQDLIDQLIEGTELKPSNSFFDWFWFHRLQPAILAACLVLIMFGGPFLTVMASQTSLPGDLLYPIKRITERAQVRIASDEAKAQIQVDFAFRRIEELDKITTDSFSEQEKTAKTKEVINDLTSNLTEASLAVKNMSKEEVAIMAKKTKKIKQDLSEAKDEIPLAAHQELAEAEIAAEDINNQIRAVLVGDEEETDEVATSTDEIIEDEIDEIIKEESEDNQLLQESDEMTFETTTVQIIE